MATTPKIALTLLEVGQREKEATINDGLTKIDTEIGMIKDTRMLADAVIDPIGAYPAGTLYYNTLTSKLRVLRPNLNWSDAA